MRSFFRQQAVALAVAFAAMPLVQAQTEADAAKYQGITHIDVFANSAMHVEPGFAPEFAIVQIYRVDGMSLVEQEINIQLPPNEAEAMEFMRDYDAQFRAKYQERIDNAARGLSQAIGHKLTRIPAVVINQRFVVYGVTDLDEVATLFQQSVKRSQP